MDKNMVIGHYGVAFAAKPVGVRLEARAPLWVWFIASQWMEVVWSFLVLLGIERLRIVPGFTEANALDLYYMPYTHRPRLHWRSRQDSNLTNRDGGGRNAGVHRLASAVEQHKRSNRNETIARA